MKLVLLVIAMAVASANAQSCQLKKVLYKPVPPSYTLGEDQVNDVRIEPHPKTPSRRLGPLTRARLLVRQSEHPLP